MRRADDKALNVHDILDQYPSVPNQDQDARIIIYFIKLAGGADIRASGLLFVRLKIGHRQTGVSFQSGIVRGQAGELPAKRRPLSLEAHLLDPLHHAARNSKITFN